MIMVTCLTQETMSLVCGTDGSKNPRSPTAKWPIIGVTHPRLQVLLLMIQLETKADAKCNDMIEHAHSLRAVGLAPCARRSISRVMSFFRRPDRGSCEATLQQCGTGICGDAALP